MEASLLAVNTKSCLSLHSRRNFPIAGDLRKQSLSIGVGCSLRATKRNNCLRFGFGSTSLEREGVSIQSLNKARFIRAQVSAELGDVDEINVGPSASSGYVGVGCVGGGIGVLLLSASCYVAVSKPITVDNVAVAISCALSVAAYIIGMTFAFSLMDKLGRIGLLPARFSPKIHLFTSPTNDRSILSNVNSLDDIDTYVRVVALKTAGIPLQQAQVLAKKLKGLPESKFDSLVNSIRLDQLHEKETEALRKKLQWWIHFGFGILWAPLVIVLCRLLIP